MKLELQVNNKAIETGFVETINGHRVLLTPPIGEGYYLMRVPVSEGQAVVCFPKFGIIGIGFEKEEDWNTNLPHSFDAEQILKHIRHNKGDDSIPDERCLEAIRLLQQAIAKLKE